MRSVNDRSCGGRDRILSVGGSEYLAWVGWTWRVF